MTDITSMDGLTGFGATVTVDEVMSRPDYAYSPPEVFTTGIGAPADVPGVINVLDYGAVADAGVDNRAAIQAAIDAAEAAGGGLVYLPSGIYGIAPDVRDDGVIQLKDNVFLMGDGIGESVLRLMDGTDHKIVGIVRSPWGGNTDNWGIADLTIDGNRDHTTKKVDAFYSGGIPGDVIADHDVYVLRIEARNNSGYGFDPHERTLRLLIEDSVAHGNGLDGFVADHCIDTVFRNNLAYGNDRHGFNVVTTSNDLLLKDNISRDNGSAGIAVQRGSEEIATPHNILIQGGLIEGNAKEGVLLWLTENVRVTGLDIRDSGTYGIRIRGASDVTVEGNNITGSSAAGADIYPDIQVADFDDLMFGRIYQARDNLIRNNTITASPATPSSRGIDERASTGIATVDHNAFVGNVISGQVRGPASLAGETSVLRLTGSAFADIIKGGGSGDWLAGSDGDDVIEGRGGNDLLQGDGGADDIKGGEGGDLLAGGAGTDKLQGENGDDTLSGASQADRLSGGAGADRLAGGAGDDQVTGGLGSDTLIGGEGADKLEGAGGSDSLTGGLGIDTLKGGASADVLEGGRDGDSLYGGEGNDRLAGGIGSDKLLGEAGRDRLAGGQGEDSLEGGADDDRLYGGRGNDKLVGGAGNDMLDGGAGRDRYVLLPGGGHDIIVAFEAGSDRIDLTAFDLSRFRQVERAMADTHDGVLLSLEDGTSVTIRDVVKGDLDSGDFML